MCKTGGPRCPQTPGKKARRKLNDKVNKVVQDSGMTKHDWKFENPALYDRMMKEAFDPYAGMGEAEEDVSWLNYRETGTRTSGGDEDRYKEYDENGAFWAMVNDTGSDQVPEEEFADYGDMVSEDPHDVNAFLQATFQKEIEAAVADYEEDPEGYMEQLDEDEDDDGSSYREYLSYVAAQKREAPISRRSNAHLLPPGAKVSSPTPNPVFVYGTLRSGQGNYRNILLGNTQKEQEGAMLPSASMYSNGGFPYVMEDDAADGVKGDLMYLDYDKFGDTLQNLDWLEGTGSSIEDDHNHYNRQLRYVQVGDNEYVQAWVYMPPEVDRPHITSLRRVKSGDWMNRADG